MDKYFSFRGKLTPAKKKIKSIVFSLYLSYQIRLNSREKRTKYQDMVFRICQSSPLFEEMRKDKKSFSAIIEEELQWFIE